MSKRWSKFSARSRGVVLITIPVLSLVITLGAWSWSRQSEIALAQKVDHTEQIITQTNNLLIILLNAETGVRGYTVTKDQRFLEPYQKAIAELPLVLNKLKQLVLNDHSQPEKWRQIEESVWARMNLLTERINLASNQPPPPTSQQQYDLLYRGKESMDRVRFALAELEKQKKDLLDFQSNNLNHVRRVTETIQWLTSVSSVIAYLAALFLFKQIDKDLKQREIQLRESTTLIQAIVSNVVDGVVTVTTEGKIEFFNPAASKMFGYQAEEVIDNDLSMLLEKHTQEEYFTINEVTLNKPIQLQGKRKDGTFFPIEISLSEIQINNRLIAIIRDVTERLQTEENLKARANELASLTAILARTNTDLEKRNQELDKFAYVASHDLKAPLRAIANLSQWIEDDLEDRLPPENKHQLQLLRKRVHRLESLINGLLQYSRVGRLDATIEIVEVDVILKEVIDSVNPPPTFKIEIEAGMPILKTRRISLTKVFSGLIDNAIRHHDRNGGNVKISHRDLGTFYEFTVTDDGPGIAPEYHEKVFVIFQTLEPRDKVENTGIGLSIVKKIVETEGGTISLDSEVGKGATFRFTWPK